MACNYPNLEWMLQTQGIKRKWLALALGICRNSISNKLHGHTKFKESEMKRIQEIVAPGKTLDYIFSPVLTVRRKKA